MDGDMRPEIASWVAYAKSHGLIRDLPTPAWPSKYRAERVAVNGRSFASKREAARYVQLKALEAVGQIAGLECQPVFPLHVMEIWRSQIPIVVTTVGRYTADFRYTDLTTGELVIEDVKSPPTRTEAYRLRKRLAEAIHGITITEV